MKPSKLADELMRRLTDAGYEAYLVGGCVRDSLMGIEPHDFDICTNALPAQIKTCFEGLNTFDAGVKHGTVSAELDGEVCEVTTYRIDGEYSDNRHPDSVTFTRSLAEDLRRRDFTINAMAYNDKNGLADPCGGRADLELGIIRCVGEPDRRFNEDALRILRALRFAAMYGFTIEKLTEAAIFKNAPLLKNIAAERIAAELLKLLCGKFAAEVLDRYRTIFTVIIPEIAIMFDYDQRSKHHCYDLWHHTLHAVKTAPPEAELRMTMLLHDVGKPYVCTCDPDGTRHFEHHQIVSKSIAERVLRRLKLSSDFINTCLLLIKHHDVRYTGSKKTVKRLLNKLGEPLTEKLFEVQYADVSAQSDYMRAEKFESLRTAREQAAEIIRNGECFKLGDMNINGKDIMALGVKQGKQVGNILKRLLTLVTDEAVANEKSALLKAAGELIAAAPAKQTGDIQND